MSNSNKDKSEESTKSIENVDAESINESVDSTSNKKTRFTKSKSISEVFKELELDEDSDELEESISTNSENISSDLDEKGIDLDSEDSGTESMDSEKADEIIPIHNEYPESMDSEEVEESIDSDSEDEIIPIHNEYNDLDKSEAFDNEVIDEDLNSSKPEDIESNVKGSFDGDSLENDATDSSQFDEEGLVIINPDDNSRKGKRNASSKSIKDAKAKQSTKSSFNLMDSSFLFTLFGLIVGIGILVMGILYYSSSSDRVVDNVLSGETAGLAIFIIIIGLLIIGFSLLRFFSSSNSETSAILDMLNNIRNIDYNEVKEDNITRDDFESVFSSVLGKDKNSSFSNKNGDNKESVDKNSDLLEADDDISDDIDILYSESNLSSRKNRSSSKKANSKDSADDSDEYTSDESFDSSFDEGISSDESSDDFSDDENSLDGVSSDDEVEKMSNLKDKYAKYDFSEDSDEDSKPKFKKTVDFDKIQEELSEEQLEAQKQKRKEELAIKKRRIIQGTNFDNSLRKK